MIKKLLTDFLTFNVVIATDMRQSVQMANGDIAEIPLVVEGVLLDFDKDFILLGANSDPDDVELLNRDMIVSIKPVDLMKQEMDDLMNKDGRGAVN